MTDIQKIQHDVAMLVSSLPPLSETIDELKSPSLNPEQKAHHLQQIIEQDSGLCTDLLRLANCSCIPDEKKPIETVLDAIAVVGVPPLIEFIEVSYASKHLKEQCAVLKHWDDYVAHSKEISNCCRIMAEVLGLPREQSEMYAVAGLIHDMGRLIMMIAAERNQASLLGTSCEKMASIIHDESEAWGMNHCEIGSEICHKWTFSPILEEVVLRHHTPLVGDDFSYPGALIFVAHFITMSDFTGEIIETMLKKKLLSKLNLNASFFEKVRSLYGEKGSN